MREILFRGQTRKKGEKVRLDGSPIDSNWVYGGIFPNNKGGDFAIIYQQYPKIEKYTVYADTVGQYTGFLDKNGKKIFEGDIIQSLETKETAVVQWFPEHSAFMVWCKSSNEVGFLYECTKSNIEVIGNIHDNPELLKQEV